MKALLFYNISEEPAYYLKKDLFKRNSDDYCFRYEDLFFEFFLDKNIKFQMKYFTD